MVAEVIWSGLIWFDPSYSLAPPVACHPSGTQHRGDRYRHYNPPPTSSPVLKTPDHFFPGAGGKKTPIPPISEDPQLQPPLYITGVPQSTSHLRKAALDRLARSSATPATILYLPLPHRSRQIALRLRQAVLLESLIARPERRAHNS